MRKFFPVLCGVAAGLLAAPAMAQESFADSGSYISLAGVGTDGSIPMSTWTDTGPAGDRIWSIDYHYGGLVALGYQWAFEDSPADFRAEIEGGYRRTYFDGLIDPGGALLDVDGYLETGSVMANGYVDFRLGDAISPYVGIGVGGTRIARRDVTLSGVPVASDKFTYTTAMQLMAGVGYKLSPGTVLGLEYRFMEMRKFSFPGVSLLEDIHFNEILITFRLVG